MKSLDSFDLPAIPPVNRALVMQLARCEYIERRENVIAAGNSGAGKTHVVLGLGLAACQIGMSVGFTTAAGLVHELMEARDERRRLNLLIIGELGFVPRSRTGAELLFEVLSILVTANQPFGEWTGVFGSERLTGALLEPAHPPRPHPGDERRELPAQAQPGEGRPASSGRHGRRVGRTGNHSPCPVRHAPVCVTFLLNNGHGHSMLASWRGRFRWASTALMAQHPAALDNRFSAKREEAQGPPPYASVRLNPNPPMGREG